MHTVDRSQSSSPEPSQGSPTALTQWEKQEARWVGGRDCLLLELVHGQGVGRDWLPKGLW